MSAPRVTRRVALLTALLVLVVAVAAVVGYVVWPRGSEFQRAAGLLPDKTLRVSWTDWAALRDQSDVDDPTGAGVEDFLAELSDADYSVSSLASAAAPLKETLGFSPVESEWEILGQSRSGMVMILKLGEDADFEAIAEKYTAAGFTRPDDDALSGGVWEGGPDVVSGLEGLESPELQNVAFLEDEGLLLSSDTAAYLRTAVPFAQGDKDGLDLSDLAGPAGDPLAAVVLDDDLACDSLSMRKADPDAQTTADQLVEQAGGVSPLKGYLVALGADRSLTLVFDFENDDQAEKNARSREALAGAEDPGQLLAYDELFDLDDVVQDGHRVVLTATTVGGSAPLSNLAAGPVLLASC
ncbi:MAG: hypothetical protein ABWX84_12760 [Nocardioides sp.]